MFSKVHEINTFDGTLEKIKIEYPSVCPICHTGCRPNFIYGHFDESNTNLFTAMFACDPCGKIFMSKYRHTSYEANYLFSIPNGFQPEIFSERINLLSPKFVEVYNQSLHAEELGLKEICGAGYRKSIEYLMKDFCTLLDEESKDSIWNENLGSTINRIDDRRMRALSFAVKEIGNDQTHTVIKLSEGLQEMKEFINALVSYIDFIGASNVASGKFPHK